MISDKEISLLTDLLILESFNDSSMVKNAQTSVFISSIFEHVKEFVSSHLKPGDTTGSVINMLAPGFIATIFRSFNMPWIGLLVGLLMNVLGVDVAGLIRTFFSSVKSAASNGPISSSQINDLANNITNQYSPMESQSYDRAMKDAKLLKLALINYQESLNKNAWGRSGMFGGIRSGLAVSTFVKLLKWIAIAILSAGGLLVAGDTVNKVVGRPSSFDKIQTNMSQQPSTQTKFKQKPSYSDVDKNTSSGNAWFERVTNDKSSIENLLISFARSVYDLSYVDDNAIKNAPGFKAVVKNILDWNIQSPNDSITFIPDIFKNKKDIVDHFIDDIANK